MSPASRSHFAFRQRIIGAPLLVAALVWSAPPAFAEATSALCSFSPPEVDIINSDPSTKVIRSGDDILIDGATCGDGVTGPATVTNTALIHFYDNFGGHQRGTISLVGGPFAPGLDTGASAEIDFTYTSTNNLCDLLTIAGTPEIDHITWGGGWDAAANLNADEVDGIDADLVVLGCAWCGVSGGKGDDQLSAAGGAGTGNPARYLMRLSGGPGDDVMRGGAGPDRMVGGSGADRLSGGRYSDLLLNGGDGRDHIGGGDGKDRLLGEAGRDVLVGGDGNDHLDGGPGFDTCKGGAGTDKFISCEKVIQ
jgi:Ca2+-binding RTX toxin-like protein